jgi:hypothetical protein
LLTLGLIIRNSMASACGSRRDVAAVIVYAIPTVGLMLQGLLYLVTS